MALLDGLAARIEQRARATAARTSNLVEAGMAEIPDIKVHREGDQLVISGRGLMRRWLGDVRLRFALWSGR